VPSPAATASLVIAREIVLKLAQTPWLSAHSAHRTSTEDVR
jgi:chorismate-pyruvate lyase